MKKALFGIALISLAFASCNDKNCNKGESCATHGDRTELYAGILPAADAEGVFYSLVLDYDDDDNYTTGDFELTQSYLMRDTVAPTALQAGLTSVAEGDFTLGTKGTAAETIKYITLTPKAKDAIGNADSAPLYFLVNDDNTLTMVSADLTKAENDSLNYTLTRKN